MKRLEWPGKTGSFFMPGVCNIFNDSLLMAGGYGQGYEIKNAVLFDGSAYLSRTPGSAGSTSKMTFSAWLKPEDTSAEQYILSAGTGNAGYTDTVPFTNNKLGFHKAKSSSTDGHLYTNRVFRDYASWMHVCLTLDDTTMKMEVNGAEVTDFQVNTVPSQPLLFLNQAVQHLIGSQSYDPGTQSYKGLMAEVYYFDGQALTADNFGEFVDGIFVPKRFAGTFGSADSYLKFSNAANPGEDSSGNGNDWTVNGTITQVEDVPTNSVGLDVGNDCVLDQNNKAASGITLSNGNRTWAGSAADKAVKGSFLVSSGKWYWEFRCDDTPFSMWAGIANPIAPVDGGNPHNNANCWAILLSSGSKYNGSGAVAYGSAYADTNIGMCAYDADNGKVWWGKNGTWFASGDPASGTNAAFTNVTGDILPITGNQSANAEQMTFFFNDSDFTYTPPTGFKSLSTQNLPKVAINPQEHFNTILYTGNGTAIGSGGNSITGVGFQPDFVWAKDRDAAADHVLYDSVRGVHQNIRPNDAVAEATDTEGLDSFDADGFTVGNATLLNTSGHNYAGWCVPLPNIVTNGWSGAGNDPVEERHGAFMSIVRYDGTGVNMLVNHSGLGQGLTPSMIIVKDLDAGSTNWGVCHVATGPTMATFLNLSNAANTSSTYWNNTSPTSQTFSIGTTAGFNTNGRRYIAYLFYDVPGVASAFSYQANNSVDGPFIPLDFDPAFCLLKSSDDAANWQMLDSVRSPNNEVDDVLFATTTSAETSGPANLAVMDFVSNGIKFRSAGQHGNYSTVTYIGYAIANTPFAKNNRAR